MKLTKFLALFDIHIGRERGLERGKWVVRQTFNRKAIKAVIEFAKDFVPDVLILGGDQLNFGPISHWNKGKPIIVEDFRIKWEMDTLDELVLKPFQKTVRKIWLDGNHEVWLRDFIASNPGIAGLVEPENYLDLYKRGYEVYSQGEIYKIGKLNFVHGDVCLGRGSGVNPARTLVNAYRKNVRAGHIHTYSAAIEQTAIDARDWHSATIVPSLSNRNPFFIKNNPNCFINGFLWGYVDEKSGEFTDQVTLINKDKFIINGKKYSGT